MSRPSVEQDPGTGLWHWYDETWDRHPTTYATRREAQAAQNRYIDEVLEGNVRNWYPNLGDYVWYQEWPDSERQPAQVTGEALASNDDWIIRTLKGKGGIYVRQHTLEPMNEMEVIALAVARDDLDI